MPAFPANTGSRLTLGPLRGPALQAPPSCDNAAATNAEINEKGVYVHKTSRDWARPDRNSDLVKAQLAKIVKGEVPTPATLVGPAFHKVYNNRSWTDTGGLVFAPDTVSVLSYKGDIHSHRLSRAMPFSRDSTVPVKKMVDAYACQVANDFNKLGVTQSLINHRRAKQLRLCENIDLQREKYRELSLRANLCFQKQPAADTDIEDVSSKFLIAKLIMREKPIAAWTKADLLTWFDRVEHKEKPQLDQLLAHAKRKLGYYGSDEDIRNYLNTGSVSAIKKNHYRDMVREWGALPANEHLLMPTPSDVIGLLVTVDSVFGIDHARIVLDALTTHTSNGFPATATLPMMTYRLSDKIGQSLSVTDVHSDILPWSSAALVEFAECGVITIDGTQIKPDHFRLIHTAAHHSALISLHKDTAPGQAARHSTLIDDLSMVS